MSLWFAISAVALALALSWPVWRRVRRARGIVVDERGILEPTLGWGWIPWDEIEGAYTPSSAEGDTLHVRLRVSERLALVLRNRRVDRETPLTDSLEIRLDLARSRLSAVELLQEIMAHQPPPGGSR